MPVSNSPRTTATDVQGYRRYVYRSESGGSAGPSCSRRDRRPTERPPTPTRHTYSPRDLTLTPGTQITPYPPDSLGPDDDSSYSIAAKFQSLNALASLDASFTRDEERGSPEEMTLREYSLKYIKPELEIIANPDTWEPVEDALSHLLKIFGTPPAKTPAEEFLLTSSKFKGIDKCLKSIDMDRDQCMRSVRIILNHFERLATTIEDVDILRPMASGLQVTTLEDLEADFFSSVSRILSEHGGWKYRSDTYSKQTLKVEDNFLVRSWYERTVKATSNATGRVRRLAAVAKQGLTYLENWPVPKEQPQDTVRLHSDPRHTETSAGKKSSRTSKRADTESQRTSSDERRDFRNHGQVR